MQVTYNNVAKQMMIDICMTTLWGLDALMDRHPEQIRWRTLSQKLEDCITYMAFSLEGDKIDDYQCKRFYVNIWKHISKLELDYYLRFEEIIRVVYKDSKKNETNIDEYDISKWENLALIFQELNIESNESEMELMNNRVSDTNIEKVIQVVEKSSESKSLSGVIHAIVPTLGFNLGYTEPQLKTLLKALIDGKFLDSQTNKGLFVHAFNGGDLTKFKKFTWLQSKTTLSLFIGHLVDDNKWKIAETIFKNCNSRNLAKTFSNAQSLEKHKPVIKLFREILERHPTY